MPYEVPKANKAVVPLFIVNRTAELLKQKWPWLSDQIDDLKPGDEIIVAFRFKIKAVRRAYDEEGRITQDFVVISPGWDE